MSPWYMDFIMWTYNCTTKCNVVYPQIVLWFLSPSPTSKKFMFYIIHDDHENHKFTTPSKIYIL